MNLFTCPSVLCLAITMACDERGIRQQPNKTWHDDQCLLFLGYWDSVMGVSCQTSSVRPTRCWPNCWRRTSTCSHRFWACRLIVNCHSASYSSYLPCLKQLISHAAWRRPTSTQPTWSLSDQSQISRFCRSCCNASLHVSFSTIFAHTSCCLICSRRIRLTI